jgi:hypothetical protein
VQNFRACVNVQHDCHKGNCAVTLTRRRRVERQTTGTMDGELRHTDDRNYIINSAALSSISAHRGFTDLPVRRVDGTIQIQGLHEGLAQWHLAGTRSGPPMPVDVIDPSLT